ncbi:hypothetical protein JD844_003030 [Phrynosoma platyrhinos]|uniref:Kelch-like protein 7 n=1 Tax=Phrynosoma platyrhinos TaxID=52577 RepID=A0ABQ7TD87_PHRPL|nr:hypothetical protein JD844_003030 [Phrynosoma platyrhinos]
MPDDNTVCLIAANMIESKSFEVELKDAEPDIIEQLVEFAYTARISVNSNNVQSLLDAANQYQIEPVKKMCVDFLKEQVDASNCLGISVLAECLDCPELKATADDFIHQHFTEVYKTDEFLQLDVKRVTHLLNQDTLTVRAEDQVYDAAVRWLKYDEPNRQPYMVDILAKVRFPLISKNFLSKTVQAEPLIQDNPECLKMVIRTERDNNDPSSLQKENYFASPIHFASVPFMRVEEIAVSYIRVHRLWYTGGAALLRKHMDINIFSSVLDGMDLVGNKFPFKLTESPCAFLSLGGMRYHLLSPEDREELVDGTRPRRKKHDYRIALFGGSQPQSCRYFNPKLFPIKRMDCYNVVKDSWYSKLGPPTPRDSLAACAAEGKIYTSGGSEVGNSALYLFECYDTRTESWHTKPSMLTQRCSHGMVEANGLIYVCGGSLGNNVSGRVLSSCEVYDPATETWTELCPMLEARKNHGLVFVKDKIFAVGGQNGLADQVPERQESVLVSKWLFPAVSLQFLEGQVGLASEDEIVDFPIQLVVLQSVPIFHSQQPLSPAKSTQPSSPHAQPPTVPPRWQSLPKKPLSPSPCSPLPLSDMASADSASTSSYMLWDRSPSHAVVVYKSASLTGYVRSFSEQIIRMVNALDSQIVGRLEITCKNQLKRVRSNAGGLDNVEYYDIKVNEWKMVSPMPWKGVTVKCAAVGSIIYVLAGFQGVGRLGHILEYNTETDKWIANSKVRAFPVTSCLICVVDTCGANEETLET